MSMLTTHPEESVLDWMRSILGPNELVFEFGHSHGYSRLWRVEYSEGFAWLKMHARQDKCGGEIHALTHWTPQLGHTPTLIAHRNDPRAVILSEVPGVNAEELTFTSEQEERMWMQAGDWLRRLHSTRGSWFGNVNPDGTPYSEPSFDPKGFVLATFTRRIREGRDLTILSEFEIDFVEGRLREIADCLAGETPVAIHRDFSPRNWMALPDGTLTSIIDFEHARWDVRAADLNRPPDYEFLRNPRLRDAFYEGYGEPSERLKAQIEVLRLLQATAGVVWAVLVGDQPYSDRNREALHRIMSECKART
jgi:Ser/Thr protein kinase RdoA (MazF antagonist)